MTITINLLATLAWLATWLLIGTRLRERLLTRQPQHRQLLIVLWVVALLMHGLTILHAIWQTPGITIHFAAAGSIVMWLCSILLFVTMLTRPLETMGIFVLPFTLTAMLLPLLNAGHTDAIDLGHGVGVHIFISLLAYSILTLASLQAMLLALQNKHLHNHHPGGLIRTLPPLLDMEDLLFKLVLLGVILLSFGLLSGSLYVDNLFGQHLVHKTILSIIAWIVFTTLLVGHWQYGWRGRIAIRWTLSGFFILMLAFFGSKFVLEFLVKPA
ncbi:MAG TPA: cytochrome c biogenesis protein CcsA [Candidatus Thiothrix moscowensis]|uniref:cytochrome C assembly family protein n=1 Tax=unclassified Thiothrix TaxID=2636184 RepID=UPI001A2F8C14|nr:MULTISPECIES: cytochrome c biogenesis protein CcsA [unclassified Thiothrix]MBJ6609285.1 cytochrome c biogenesis protein CcsA [Candidatus Thiothrix moscowensis]HRJ51682.1 cytochrome c biogenesis protein CcsA [Candidatus Thiothrix moscowensis]HRJ91997.1 cytochrome c biogenesis protein CcsA [Candidatus Thiothrix moscowensis]